jgi:hypothetical protein
MDPRIVDRPAPALLSYQMALWPRSYPELVYGMPDQPSSPIRVLVAHVPMPLEGWLARMALDQDDIVIVAQPRGYVETLLAAQKGVDVVVLGAQEFPRLPGICSHLLGEYPDTRILLLSASGDRAMLCWTGLHQKEVPIAPAEALLETLRHLDALTAASGSAG